MKPWPRDALPTKLHRFRLDKETSKDFLRACKERGLTAAYGIGACLILATLELFRTEEEITMGYDDAVIVVTFNLRRWMAEKEGLKGTASSAETGLLIAATGLFDCMIAEGRMEVEHCLWFIAEQLKEFFTDRLKQISSFAGKGAHGFWHAYNQEAAAMASGQSETTFKTGIGLNSVGIVEAYLKRSYGTGHGGQDGDHTFAVQDCQIDMRCGGSVSQPHIWTFRNQTELNMGYVEAMFTPQGPELLAR
ncbi:hypothetical protein FA10DRAFT_293369 [Acaromyces ingoldii]|nr:hypothetical protein FA10DRAFT_293369 [Acaromyces ingoldii]PWN86419.1 hypothetical protein FA10DRAFT_293369 [Acaromyces ingoldii]